MADRWVDPGTGTVTVAGKDFGQDVRPCNERAEVSFAHKTGFTYNYLSDAGIVRSFAGPEGDYIVVMMSNLGYRYADSRQATGRRPVCGDDPAKDDGVCYTEKFAALGSVDRRHPAAPVTPPPERRVARALRRLDRRATSAATNWRRSSRRSVISESSSGSSSPANHDRIRSASAGLRASTGPWR